MIAVCDTLKTLSQVKRAWKQTSKQNTPVSLMSTVQWSVTVLSAHLWQEDRGRGGMALLECAAEVVGGRGDYWRHLMTHCLLSVSSGCCDWRKTLNRFKHNLVCEEDEFWSRSTHPVTFRLAPAAAARPNWDLWASLLCNYSCTSIIVECCWLRQQNGIRLMSFTCAWLLLLSLFPQTNESVVEMSTSGFWWLLWAM